MEAKDLRLPGNAARHEAKQDYTANCFWKQEYKHLKELADPETFKPNPECNECDGHKKGCKRYVKQTDVEFDDV